MRIHKEKHIHFSILHPSSDRDSNVSQRAVNGRGLLQNVMSKRIELLYYYIFPNLILVIFIQKNQIFFINKGDRLKTSTCIKYDS